MSNKGTATWWWGVAFATGLAAVLSPVATALLFIMKPPTFPKGQAGSTDAIFRFGTVDPLAGVLAWIPLALAISSLVFAVVAWRASTSGPLRSVLLSILLLPWLAVIGWNVF